MVRGKDIKVKVKNCNQREYPVTLNTSVMLGCHHEAKPRWRSLHEINSDKEQLIRRINLAKKLLLSGENTKGAT